ncbi:MAG: fused MFS/spermidine synthase [Isosphaeraceae bacterium]
MTNPTAGRSLALLYATTVLISAFLLFQVQPVISKYILPWFGGGPTVWTTCLLFFQLALFAGYAYAHALGRLSSRWARLLIHAGLLAAAVALLPIAPDPSWRSAESGDPTARILALLAVSVGLPYFALSATGPLLQTWFRDSFPGRSPYRLYALSNVGSLAALVSYPFLVEPALPVQQQATAWSRGFGLFAVLCGLAAAFARRGPSADPHSLDATESAPRPWQWAAWLGLPALASVALLATTNHVCRDVAVVPFLWVAPLALYLLTFIIAFDHERWYLRRTFAALLLPLAVLLSSMDLLPVWLSYDAELALHFLGLFLLCMIAHGELARLRPSPRHLTAFYLAIAAGGGLGGVLVTLVAPRVFDGYLEWPITLVAGFALALGLLWREAGRIRPLIGLAGLVGLAILAQGQGWFSRELIPGRMGAHYNEGYSCRYLSRTRGFFGVYTVLERRHSADRSLDDRAMFSGQVPHGLQLSGAMGRPTTYYGHTSGVGRALDWYSRDSGKPRRVGVVGLGVGTLAAYARPGDTYRFYEISDDVERIARDWFRFLGDCRGTVEVEIGDGRIALEREDDQQFDVLVIDAFSGDAIPAHLLTREAMELYLRHLAPGGTIAIHISNAYLDLAPVVRGLAREADMGTVRIWSSSHQAEGLYMADWYLLSRDAAFLDALRPSEDEDPEPRRVLHWTDARSNLFEILQ